MNIVNPNPFICLSLSNKLILLNGLTSALLGFKKSIGRFPMIVVFLVFSGI